MTLTQQHDPALLRLIAGRARAAELAPYLSTALFAMKPVREARVKTLGVDEYWRMYWAPEFVQTLTVDECAGAWVHEVGHLLRDHRARFNALLEPNNRHPLWNKAADAAINQDLRESGMVLPKIKAIYPETIPGAKPGMTAEQMYRLVLDTPDADKVATQRVDLLLLPPYLVKGNAQGQRIIGMTRTGFLNPNDTTITVTGDDGEQVALAEAGAADRRTLSFVFGTEPAPGRYTVTVTSGDTSVEAELPIVTPEISVRPDHIPGGWTTPYRVTVQTRYHDLTTASVVTMTNPENDTPVAIGNVEHVSARVLTFDITEPVPDGMYAVTVTDGTTVMSAGLPIGLPFLDIFPSSLPVGHGAPYPFAAVADDFTFDATTRFDLHQISLLGPLPIEQALSGAILKSATTADFTLDVRLDEGQYLVRAQTGDEEAVALLTVSNNPDPDDDPDGDGDDDSDDGGGGGGSGSDDSDNDANSDSDGGSGEGGGSGNSDFDDCGSGAGGRPRDYERGPDTSDGAVDSGRGSLIREETARAIEEHVKSRGTVPGGWERWSQTILKPVVDWRKELRSVVRRTCATVAGMRDYTYQRPSRRSVPNVVLPAMRAPHPPRVANVVDTSGSVSDRMLGQAIGDMSALLKQITASGGLDMKIIACDAAAAEMKSIRDMRNLTALEGGGGTDMRVGIKAAAEITPKMDMIITFTDGETPWPEEPPAENPRAKYVAVLLAGEPSEHYQVPDWMHKIVVDPRSMEAA